jgi:hypothetical protein
MRNSYWSCSAFANWLRGTPKPISETSDGWRQWNKEAKKQHPIRYWLAEEGLDKIQKFINFIPDRLYACKYYINNRWVTKTHALTASPSDIPRGEWRDVGNRFLPCLFNELRDFVEVELAWWHIAWSDTSEKKKYNAPFWATGWWRWRVWRCPQAGLDNLAWQMEVTNADFLPEDQKHLAVPTQQAINAQEIHKLYNWWVNVRPMRPDPFEISGWSKYCADKRKKFDDALGLFAEDDVDTSEMTKIIDKLEQDYEQEDEDMMIRLIKVRHALWT